jgi:hypothetical protein
VVPNRDSQRQDPRLNVALCCVHCGGAECARFAAAGRRQHDCEALVLCAHRLEQAIVDRVFKTDLAERDVSEREFVFGRLGLEGRVLAQQREDRLAH